MARKYNIFKTNKKLLILSVFIVVVLALAGSFFLIKHKSQEASTPTDSANQTDTSNINYGPPTEEEKAQADQHKDQVIERNNLEQNNTKNNSVTPVITSATQDGQQIMVTAYVPGIFEDGGTCTLSAQHGSSTLTKTTDGFANATTTDCAPFFIGRSEFSEAGDWSVTVSYSSESANGTSLTQVLDIK